LNLRFLRRFSGENPVASKKSQAAPVTRTIYARPIRTLGGISLADSGAFTPITGSNLPIISENETTDFLSLPSFDAKILAYTCADR